jgi:hypothetical protein
MEEAMVKVPKSYSSTIRTGIAGEWSVPEFADLMSQIQLLTGMTIFLTPDGQVRQESADFFKRWQIFAPTANDLESLERFGSNWGMQFRAEFRRLLERMGASYALEVEKVEFASPGSIDLAGFGKFTEQVRLFIKDTLDRRDNRKSREIQDEIAKQELYRRKIENAQSMLSLGKSAGLDDERIRMLVAIILDADTFFLEKKVSGQITSVQKVEAIPARA